MGKNEFFEIFEYSDNNFKKRKLKIRVFRGGSSRKIVLNAIDINRKLTQSQTDSTDLLKVRYFRKNEFLFKKLLFDLLL